MNILQFLKKTYKLIFNFLINKKILSNYNIVNYNGSINMGT